MNGRFGLFRMKFLFSVLATIVVIPMGVLFYQGRMAPQMRFHDLLVREKTIYPLLTLDAGDALFEKLRLPDAAGVYKRILRDDSDNYQALWRLARCYSMLGVLDKEKRRIYIPMAIHYARIAVRKNVEGFEGHLYLAESLGISLKYETPKNKVRNVREIKSEAEKAAELNPSSYRAYLILGMWHKNVEGAGWLEKQLARILFGRLPDSSLAEAVENFKKSIALKPDFIKTHYELAETYILLKKYDLAINEFETAIRCPTTNFKEENLKCSALSQLDKIHRIAKRGA